VERNHAHAEVDRARLRGGDRERAEPVGLARMVHPERAIAERLGLARGGADDVGRRGGEQRESVVHRGSPVVFEMPVR
jgi:hypothetical protein